MKRSFGRLDVGSRTSQWGTIEWATSFWKPTEIVFLFTFTFT